MDQRDSAEIENFQHLCILNFAVEVHARMCCDPWEETEIEKCGYFGI